MKTLTCRNMGVSDCDFVAKGETEEEVINIIREHASSNHPEIMKKMERDMNPSQIENIMRSKIKDDSEV